MRRVAPGLSIKPRLHLRLQLALLCLALLLAVLPLGRSANLFLIPVAAAQALVRHTLGSQHLHLHKLGWAHFLLCSLVIGVTGQASGGPWAWGVAFLGFLLLLLLEFVCWRHRGS